MGWILHLALALAAFQGGEPGERDWLWLDQRRAAALDALMPFEEASATYRSYRDLYQDVPERYFRIVAGERYEAVFVTPVGASIQQQLLNLHLEDREADFESLLSRVKVRIVRLDEDSCAAVRPRLEALFELSFSFPRRDVIVLHPVIHELAIKNGGEALRAVVVQDDHALAAWASATWSALESCAD